MSDSFYLNPVDGQDMVLIPAGRAVFGSPEGNPDARDNEHPQFKADLPDYYLGVHCVTNRQYVRFLNATKPAEDDLVKWILLSGRCHIKREGEREYRVNAPERWTDHPVVQVSWCGARAYCEWAGLRLPTELEWERGARGPEDRIYPWGGGWDADRCRHWGNRGGETTCDVDAYPEGANYWGLLNMSGNVWEWCADWYQADAYARYATGDLSAPSEGEHKLLRGGSWYRDIPADFRCAHRVNYNPRRRDSDAGFRCARGPTV